MEGRREIELLASHSTCAAGIIEASVRQAWEQRSGLPFVREGWVPISPAQPAKADAISKMMDGSGTGKGLNVKGKSAKTGRLSGAVLSVQFANIAKHVCQQQSIPGVIQ